MEVYSSINFEEAYTELDEVARIRARQSNTTLVFVPDMNRLDQLYSRLYQRVDRTALRSENPL